MYIIVIVIVIVIVNCNSICNSYSNCNCNSNCNSYSNSNNYHFNNFDIRNMRKSCGYNRDVIDIVSDDNQSVSLKADFKSIENHNEEDLNKNWRECIKLR